MNQESKQKRIHRMGCRLFVAILAGIFSAASAKELPNEEKVAIIKDIVADKIADAQGAAVALPELFEAVSERMALTPDKANAESNAIIDESIQRAKIDFPDTDAILRARFSKQTEQMWPSYKTGQKIEVLYYLAGKPFSVSGIYYRKDSKYVWVGSKKILISTLAPDYVPRFDSEQARKTRCLNYISKKIEEYHKKREERAMNYLAKSYDRLQHALKKVKYNGHWVSAKVLTLFLYEEAFTKQKKKILDRLQQAKDAKTYQETFDILEELLRQYPKHPQKDQMEDLLVSYKTMMTKDRKVPHDAAIHALEELLRQYPHHSDKNTWENVLISRKIEMVESNLDFNRNIAVLQELALRFPNRDSDRIKRLIEFCTATRDTLAKCSPNDILNSWNALSQYCRNYPGSPYMDKIRSVMKKYFGVFQTKAASDPELAKKCARVTFTCSLKLNNGDVVAPECLIYILAANPDIEKKFVQYRAQYEKGEIESSMPVITHQQNMDRLRAAQDRLGAMRDIHNISSYAEKNELAAATFRAEAAVYLPPGNYTVCAFTSYGNASLRWVKHINAYGKSGKCILTNDGEGVLMK